MTARQPPLGQALKEGKRWPTLTGSGARGETIAAGLYPGPLGEHVRHVHLQQRKSVQYLGPLYPLYAVAQKKRRMVHCEEEENKMDRMATTRRRTRGDVQEDCFTEGR